MATSQLSFLTISDLSKLISSKKISPVEVVSSALDRIDQLDGRVNAFITVIREEALQAARKAEQEIRSGSYRGPLHGIPISLKDIFWTKGIRTTCGSKILSDFIPQESATVAERLAEAGAILVGKTNMHEYAFGVTTNNPHYGPTRNPWDLARIPGGSSGGSGAAIAASMCTASLGTDTGGSIRIPASLCGIVGIKPTYGRVSRFGVVPLAWSLDHVGPMTKSVEDAAVMLGTIAGKDPKDASSSSRPVPSYAAALDGKVRGMRLGVPSDYFFSGLDPEVDVVVRSAIGTLRDLGAELVDVAIPSIDYVSFVSSAILQPEATAYHKENLRTRPGDYGADVRLRLEMGEFIPATDYLNAQRIKTKLVENARRIFENVDAIVAPTLPMTATPIDETAPSTAGGREAEVRRSLTSFTNPFNVLGFPAVSVPCGFSSAGLPIGLQIVSKPFTEETVLKIADAYEKATDWRLRQPEL